MNLINKQVINQDFWRGKKVFLTGHTGFKGGWLSLWLNQLGAEVRGFALEPPTEPALFNEAKIIEVLDSCIGDIRNYDLVLASIKAFQPEIIIHMAAQPLVRYSYEFPVETYATNVMGTLHVLEAARQVGSVKAIVNVTTDKCYENNEWLWGYREHEPMGGHDPYSNSKGCSELLTSAYRRSFFEKAGVAIGSARAGNVIGGGDWALDRLIPEILLGLEQGQPLVIRNPLATRPWQHVLEPLSGYLMLAQKLYEQGQAYAEAWNFGPNDEDVQPVQWIVDALVNAWGGQASWQFDDSNQPHEAQFLKLDISKARAQLGWSPRWNLKTTLEATVDWYQHWLAGGDVQAKCLEQIHTFQSERIF